MIYECDAILSPSYRKQLTEVTFSENSQSSHVHQQFLEVREGSCLTAMGEGRRKRKSLLGTG